MSSANRRSVFSSIFGRSFAKSKSSKERPQDRSLMGIAVGGEGHGRAIVDADSE